MPPRKNVRAPPSPSDRYTRSRTAALRSPLLQSSTSAPQPSTSGAQARPSRQPRSPKFYRTPHRNFESDPESSPENNFQHQVHFENTSTPARQRTTSEPDLTGSQLFTSASSDFFGFSDQETISANSDNTLNPDLIETSQSETDNMSDNEDIQQNAAANGQPPQIPPQPPGQPGANPDFAQYMAFMTQQILAAQQAAKEAADRTEQARREDQQAAREAADRAEQARREDQRIAKEAADRAEQARRDDLAVAERAHRELRETSETQIAALAEQIRILNLNKSTHPKPPTQKLEQFDLEKDGHTFKQWRSRWNTHVEFYGMDSIEDEEDRHKAQYQLLKPALSTQTLAWLDNRNLPEENAEQPEYILDHFEAYLKESVNVTMKVVDLVTMQRHQHEKIDALCARINENASFVDYDAIKKDPRDALSLVALQVAVSPELRIRIWQEKAKTYTEAVMICKQDELAHLNARMTKKDGTIAATSHYKQAQNQDRQAQQGFNRGTASENHGGSRGRYSNPTGQTMPYNGSQAQTYNSNPNLFWNSNGQPSQERGRSQSRDPDRTRARSRSKRSYPGLSFDQCYSCGKAADHPRHTCPAFLKVCDNCGKTGHIRKVCQQPQGQSQAQGASSQNYETHSRQPSPQRSSGLLTAMYASNSNSHQNNTSLQHEDYSPPASPTQRDTDYQGFIGSLTVQGDLNETTITGCPPIAAFSPLKQTKESENFQTIAVNFLDIKSDLTSQLDLVPDTGSNVTAIPLSRANPFTVEWTDKTIGSPINTHLKVLGRAQCLLSFNGMETPEYVYILDKLRAPILSRRALKALGLLHPNWPHQQPGDFQTQMPPTSPPLPTQGNISFTSPPSTVNQLTKKPTSIKFGADIIKEFYDDDPINTPKNPASTTPNAKFPQRQQSTSKTGSFRVFETISERISRLERSANRTNPPTKSPDPWQTTSTTRRQ